MSYELNGPDSSKQQEAYQLIRRVVDRGLSILPKNIVARVTEVGIACYSPEATIGFIAVRKITRDGFLCVFTNLRNDATSSYEMGVAGDFTLVNAGNRGAVSVYADLDLPPGAELGPQFLNNLPFYAQLLDTAYVTAVINLGAQPPVS